MNGVIRLTDVRRKSTMEHFRFGANARISRRDHILLLLDRDCSYRAIMNALLCGSELISDVKHRPLEGGLECAIGLKEMATSEPELSHSVYTWVVNSTPQDFGYFRTRWSCEILSELLMDEVIDNISGETVHRWMYNLEFVW